jgi:hypothetical protein
MAETLVLDAHKPYPHRFSGDMERSAQSNLSV